MLQLPLRTEDELVVLHDHVDTSRTFVSLLRPRLSPDSGGRPSLRLVHWTSTEANASGEHEVGGHLVLEVIHQAAKRTTVSRLCCCYLGLQIRLHHLTPLFIRLTP